MRVLITGGTGFIGGALARRYLERGDEVRVLGKRETPWEEANVRELEGRGAQVILGDVAERSDVRRAVEGVDLVQHLAAAMREANVGEPVYRRVNVEGTRHVLEEAERCGAEGVVHSSSVGVYGDIGGRVVDEESPCRPTHLYGRTKLEAEGLVRVFLGKSRLPVVILRPAEVYGAGDHRLLKLFRMIGKGTFVMVGRGMGHHHLVHIDDLTGAMVRAGERLELSGRVFNVAGERPVRLRELVEEISRQLGVRPPRIRLPWLPMLAAAVVTEGVCRPFGIQPPLYRRRLDFFRHDWRLDITALREVLGFSPGVDLTEGIRRTIAGYREAGLLR